MSLELSCDSSQNRPLSPLLIKGCSFTAQTVAKPNKYCDCTQDNCVIFRVFCIMNHFSVIHAKGPVF